MQYEEILEKINTGVFHTIKKNTKSGIWKIFSLIQNEENKIINGLVHCEKCNHLFKYNGKQTSNLIRHKCYVEQKTNTELKKVSSFDKENFIKVCAQWVIEDCRPFSAVSSNGFRKLAQALINIGAKYGSHVDILDLIPDPITISNRIEINAEEKRNEFEKEVEGAVMNEVASITTDVGTDDSESQLKHIMLGVKSMDFQSCTGENILAKLKCVLNDFERRITSTIESTQQIENVNFNIKTEQNNMEFEDSSAGNIYEDDTIEASNQPKRHRKTTMHDEINRNTSDLGKSTEFFTNTSQQDENPISSPATLQQQQQQQTEPFESYTATSAVDIGNAIEEDDDEDSVNIEEELDVIQNLMPRSKESLQLQDELSRVEAEYYRIKADYFAKLTENSKIKRTLMLLQSRKLQLEIEKRTSES